MDAPIEIRMSMDEQSFPLAPAGLLGGCKLLAEAGPLADGRTYEAGACGDGLWYEVPAGGLPADGWLWMDLLAEGRSLRKFFLYLTGPDGRGTRIVFGVLNQCQARLRLPLCVLDQTCFELGREGACLKRVVQGDRVEAGEVTRIVLEVARAAPEAVRWSQTALKIGTAEPPVLQSPLLPAGPLLDELGQSTLHRWPTASRSTEEVTQRLRRQGAEAPDATWPDGWSRWGGWTGRRFEASGHFRTHHDGRRWWLVDPDGHPFWSAGLDCVRFDVPANCDALTDALTWLPPADGPFAACRADPRGRMRTQVDYLRANFVRAFGAAEAEARWAQIALAHLRRFGFNTVGNWSDWRHARAAGVPFVLPLSGRASFPQPVFRDFPDVFAASFEADAARLAGPLRELADCPALIGYFLMNEPAWGFASVTPAEGMLRGGAPSETRRALAEHLRDRYRTDAALAAAWGERASFAGLAAGPWRGPLTGAARADLTAFSAVMVERLFSTLSAACRAAAPHHLNLGARYHTVPPDWALAGMTSFDVFGMNCYESVPPADRMTAVSRAVEAPVLIGEWHFGALDAGLPGSGIGRVATQADRGRAYRCYLEAAAACPACVGAHWYELYDESALGRFDGENYNIGFLDICNRPYEPLAAAARASHERLYDVAAGRAAPFDDAPQYLPRLF